MKLNLVRLNAALNAAGHNQKSFAVAANWSEAKASRFFKGQTKEVNMAMLEDVKRVLGSHANIAAILEIEDVAQDDSERELLRRWREADTHGKSLAEMALKPR